MTIPESVHLARIGRAKAAITACAELLRIMPSPEAEQAAKWLLAAKSRAYAEFHADRHAEEEAMV